MRILFFTYSILYVTTAMLMSYSNVSLFMGQLLFSLSILIMGLVTAGPIAIIISPRLIKSHKSDPKFMNYCFVAGLFRLLFWACGPFGLRDHTTILILNAFGIVIYAIIENRFKRISNEYFKY